MSRKRKTGEGGFAYFSGEDDEHMIIECKTIL